jgi:hypothetical protein
MLTEVYGSRLGRRLHLDLLESCKNKVTLCNEYYDIWSQLSGAISATELPVSISCPLYALHIKEMVWYGDNLSPWINISSCILKKKYFDYIYRVRLEDSSAIKRLCICVCRFWETYHGMNVAIKFLRADHVKDSSKVEFLQEIMIWSKHSY